MAAARLAAHFALSSVDVARQLLVELHGNCTTDIAQLLNKKI